MSIYQDNGYNNRDDMQVIFYDFYNVKYLKLDDEINVQEFEGKCEIAFNGDIED